MTTQKKVAGGFDTTTATTHNIATVSADDANRKEFATLAAQFALAGHGLIRSNPADGAAGFYATRWGMIKFLPTLDAARAFLKQIGGSQ